MKTILLLLLTILLNFCWAFSIGDLYVSFGNSGNLRKVAPDGTTSVTGIPSSGGLSNGIAFYDGSMYFSQSGSGQILKYDSDQGTGTVFASGLNNPCDIAFDAFGNLFVTEYGNNRLLKITRQGVVSVFASSLGGPCVLGLNQAGDMFISEHDGNRVSKITPGGTVSTFASIARPSGVAVDTQGYVYLNEHYTGNIYKYSPDGSSNALFATAPSYTEDMAFDAAGYLYVALNDGRIMRYNSSGVGTTFANFSGNDIDQLAFYGVSVFPVPEIQSWFLTGIAALIFFLTKRRQ